METKTKNERIIAEYEQKYRNQLNEPRIVQPYGNGAHIVVPKKYLGLSVKLVLIE